MPQFLDHGPCILEAIRARAGDGGSCRRHLNLGETYSLKKLKQLGVHIKGAGGEGGRTRKKKEKKTRYVRSVISTTA